MLIKEATDPDQNLDPDPGTEADVEANTAPAVEPPNAPPATVPAADSVRFLRKILPSVLSAAFELTRLKKFLGIMIQHSKADWRRPVDGLLGAVLSDGSLDFDFKLGCSPIHRVSPITITKRRGSSDRKFLSVCQDQTRRVFRLSEQTAPCTLDTSPFIPASRSL